MRRGFGFSLLATGKRGKGYAVGARAVSVSVSVSSSSWPTGREIEAGRARRE